MSVRALPWPALAALAVGAVIAGTLAVVQPFLGLALAVVALVVTLLARTRLSRLGRFAVAAAAVAAILGPNLALPQAPQAFGFRILIVLIGLGLVAYVLVDGRLVIPRGLPRPAGLLIALTAWSLLSVTWADDPVAALRWTGLLAMMGGLAIGLALACRNRTVAIRLVIALGVTFAFATAVAIAELRFGLRLPTSALLGRSRDAAFAATSLFGNQNNFATYLTLTLPYFLCLPVVFRDARLIVLGVAGSLVTLAALLFTGSRSNLVAAFLVVTGLVVVLATDRRRRGRAVGGVVLAALCALLVLPSLGGGGLLPLPEDAVTKLNIGLLFEQRQQQLGSGAVRSSVLEEGLALVRDTQGVGVGAGNAETQIRSLANFTGVENLHNWWLELLVNLGVVGLALFIGLYLTLFRGQLRAARRSGDPFVRWLGLSGCLALVGFVVGSLGPSSVIAFAPMWIMLGLGMLTIVLWRQEA
jgi:teichuronic acid biosynthesis protein TuaE